MVVIVLFTIRIITITSVIILLLLFVTNTRHGMRVMMG